MFIIGLKKRGKKGQGRVGTRSCNLFAIYGGTYNLIGNQCCTIHQNLLLPHPTNTNDLIVVCVPYRRGGQALHGRQAGEGLGDRRSLLSLHLLLSSHPSMGHPAGQVFSLRTAVAHSGQVGPPGEDKTPSS